jgi:hypothetical protein
MSGLPASPDLDSPVNMGPVEGMVSKRIIADKLVFSYYALLVETAKRHLVEVRCTVAGCMGCAELAARTHPSPTTFTSISPPPPTLPIPCTW